MSAVPTSFLAARRPVAPSVLARAVIAVCGLVTAGLVFAHLGAPSFWYDEAASAAFSHLSVAQLAATVRHQDAFYAFYYLLLHGISDVSQSEAALRSLSALAGVGFTIATALLAQRLAGARAAVAAAIIATCSPLAFGAAREARPYSLFMLLATLLSWAFLRAAESPVRRRWIVFVATAVLACYVHLFAIFVVAAHALWAFLVRRALYRRGFGLALAAIVAALVPLLLLIRGNGNVNAWIPRPGIADLARLGVSFAGSEKALALIVLVLCFAAVLGLLRLRRHQSPTIAEPWLFLAFWLFTPIVVVFAASLVRPIFIDRYLDGAYPAYVLLVALALARLPLAASAAAIALIVALMVKPIELAYHPSNEDWRSATAFVLAAARPGDAVVVYPSYERRGYEYYVRRLGGPAPENDTRGARDAGRTPPLDPRALRTHRLWIILASRFDGTFRSTVQRFLEPRARISRVAASSTFLGPITVIRYDRD